MTALRKYAPNFLLALLGFSIVIAAFLIARSARGDSGSAGSGSGPSIAALDAAHADVMAVYDAAPAPTGAAPGAAEASPPIPDPIDDTGGFVGEVTSSFQRGAYLQFALLLVLGLVVVLRRYVAWLRVGWRAIAVTVVASALTTMFLALGQGAAPTFAWAAGILGNAALMAINAKGDAATTRA